MSVEPGLPEAITPAGRPPMRSSTMQHNGFGDRTLGSGRGTLGSALARLSEILSGSAGEIRQVRPCDPGLILSAPRGRDNA